MKTRLLILLLAFSSVGIFSQQTTDSIQKTKTDLPITLSKNSVGVDGSIFLFVAGTSLNYERLLFRIKKSAHFYLKAGYGYCLIGENDRGFDIPVSLVFLGGKGKSHFETDLGFRTIFIRDDYRITYPIINFGYRYQRPGNGVFFKALAGTDGLTLGVGYAF